MDDLVASESQKLARARQCRHHLCSGLPAKTARFKETRSTAPSSMTISAFLRDWKESGCNLLNAARINKMHGSSRCHPRSRTHRQFLPSAETLAYLYQTVPSPFARHAIPSSMQIPLHSVGLMQNTAACSSFATAARVVKVVPLAISPWQGSRVRRTRMITSRMSVSSILWLSRTLFKQPRCCSYTPYGVRVARTACLCRSCVSKESKTLVTAVKKQVERRYRVSKR